MSPRPYKLGKRQTASERTRACIISAANELLAADTFKGFSVDAVARRAGVARMTIYYQFGSKRGLLEALFDDMAARGLVEQLPAAFARPDALEALEQLTATFGGFWAAHRLVGRRIRGLAVLDPDFEEGLRGRDERRRQGLRTILGRLTEERGWSPPQSLDEAVDALHTLTSFETFEALARTGRTQDEVAALVFRLACAYLGLSSDEAVNG